MRSSGSEFGELFEAILPPCARDGTGDDWWKEKHVSCTGSHHFNEHNVVVCSCACHKQGAKHDVVQALVETDEGNQKRST